MVTIKKILTAGGACPYQIEAETDDGQFFYLRYRNGVLRYGVWPSAEKCDCTNYLFVDQIGERYAGWADHETLSKVLDGKVQFPDGFVHQYGPNGDPHDDYPPEGTMSALHEAQLQEELKKLFEPYEGPRSGVLPS